MRENGRIPARDNALFSFTSPPGSDAQNPTGALAYTYNQRNLMTGHSANPGGTAWVVQAAYAYDGAGDRLQQVDYTSGSAITTTYSNDAMGLTQVLVADDGTEQVYNLYGLDLIAQDDGTEIRTLLADGLGSARMEMAGPAVETVTTYSPYGELLAQTGDSGTTYGFTGEQHDDATDLVYLRARYYNPSLKAFMSHDPLPGYAKLPQSQNGYSYAHNNPVLLTDPSGEIVPLIVGGLAIGAVTGMTWDVMVKQGAGGIDNLISGAIWDNLRCRVDWDRALLSGGAGSLIGSVAAPLIATGFGQGLVAYTAGYGGYESIRKNTNSRFLTVPGYVLGYENIHNDLITLNSPTTSTFQKRFAGGDILLNTILGASGFAGAANGVRSIKAAWQMRNMSRAARLAYIQSIAAKSGVELGRSNRFYRELGEEFIEYPVEALDDAWRLSGGFYHEMAHVGQEFGRLSKLRGGKLVTLLPKGLQLISTKLERGIGVLVYPFNPVEVQAFASGVAYYSQNVGYLVYDRLVLYVINRLASPDGN